MDGHWHHQLFNTLTGVWRLWWKGSKLTASYTIMHYSWAQRLSEIHDSHWHRTVRRYDVLPGRELPFKNDEAMSLAIMIEPGRREYQRNWSKRDVKIWQEAEGLQKCVLFLTWQQGLEYFSTFCRGQWFYRAQSSCCEYLSVQRYAPVATLK